MGMPFEHDISDVTSMEIIEEAGVKYLILNFRFVRYKLKLDSVDRVEQLATILGGSVVRPVHRPKDPVRLPRMYAKGGR